MTVHSSAPDDDVADKANVLIVDDLPEKLLVFRTVLEELDQNLVFVRSGSEALREVLNRDFAVILLDVNMPDIDGFETASLIRKYRKSAHTPIIFVTAYADEMQTALGYSLGAVDYILSPVVPEVLRSKVKVFVDLYNMQQRVRKQSEQKLALAAAEAARKVAEDSTRRAAFLAQASRVLSGSLDLAVATRQLIELVVPQVAALATLVVHGDTPDSARALHCELRPGGARDTTELEVASLPPRVRELLQRASEGAARLDLRPDDLGALRPADGVAGPPLAAGAVLPLVLGARVLGALLVASPDDGHEWAVLEELADRAAIAFENARLYRTLESEIVDRRQAEDKLQQLNQRKDEFLAMLSHELRNPLAPIRNAVEVIRRLAPVDAKLVRANEVMERQVRQITRLVDELLDVARISQGKIGLQLEPVDLVAVLAHGVETVRPFLDARRHTLAQHLGDGAVWMRGDFARLSQVVANLLNNAAKYTEEGGHIDLTLSVHDGSAVISVRDNGIGIEPDLLPNVFDLFEQGKRSLDRTQGGLGVGLTLVRRLVELHHGQISVASPGAGKGSEFQVRLPCLVSLAPGDLAAKAAAAPAPSAGCRVLVVDDNTDAADSVAMFLGMVGHEVKSVHDGMAALASAPVYAPDVVVLDIGLPVLDGYEVARRLRTLPQTANALLVAVTGYGSRNDRQRADEAGFDRFLVKPADPTLLADMIAQWLAETGRAVSPPAGELPAAARTTRPG